MKWQALRQEFCIAFSPNHFPCWAKHHRIVCSLFGLPDIIWALKPPSHTNLVDHIFDKTPSLGPQRAQRCGPAKEGRNRVGVDSLRLGMGEPFAWERSGSTLNWERGKCNCKFLGYTSTFNFLKNVIFSFNFGHIESWLLFMGLL